MTSARILTMLAAEGRYEVARKGSHVQLKHPFRKGRVTVSHPRTDLPIGTVKSIERQAGLRLLSKRQVLSDDELYWSDQKGHR